MDQQFIFTFGKYILSIEKRKFELEAEEEYSFSTQNDKNIVKCVKDFLSSKSI
jgi:hypothetical protein